MTEIKERIVPGIETKYAYDVRYGITDFVMSRTFNDIDEMLKWIRFFYTGAEEK